MSGAIELPDHAMAMATDRIVLSRDDRTISMVEIAMATPPTLDAATVGFRIVVVQCYGAGVGVGATPARKTTTPTRWRTWRAASPSTS